MKVAKDKSRLEDLEDLSVSRSFSHAVRIDDDRDATCQTVALHHWFLMDSDLFAMLSSIDKNVRRNQRPTLYAAERSERRKAMMYEISSITSKGVYITSQNRDTLFSPHTYIDRFLKQKVPLKLLVFDMNGVLVDRPGKGKVPVPRPGLELFLTNMFQHFALAIWTSAVQKNAVECLKKTINSEIRENIFLFLTREHCTPHRTSQNPYGTVKDLSIVWNNPHKFGKWDEKNTLLFDDSPEKGVRHPENIVVVPSFSKKSSEDNFFSTLSDFLLQEVQCTSDVRLVAPKWASFQKPVS